MAYFSQEMKKKIQPIVKKICEKYGVKASLAVRDHMTVVLNIKSGVIDFIENHNEYIRNDAQCQHFGVKEVKNSIDVNVYHYRSHFTGKALEFLDEVIEVLNTGNYDNSDAQIDYFDKGFYVDVNIGKWDSPYMLTK